jgi:DNA-binding FrmR family transcriptional regulator
MPANDREAAVRHVQRAEGQVSGLAGMISGRRPFPEVAQQLLAARGSLDSLLVRLVEIELEECFPGVDARGELDDLLRAALGRNAPARTPARRRHATQTTHTTAGGHTSP